MRPARVVQVITRWVLGGARQVVQSLLERLPRDQFEQELFCGEEGTGPAGATKIPGFVRAIDPRKDLAALFRLRAAFLERRPDVVHAHTYKAGVLASVAARLAGVPAVVFTPHGHIFSRGAQIPGVPGPGLRLAALRWITRAAQGCAHRVTALSESDRREQLALRLSPPSKYTVIRNGIDVVRFEKPVPRQFDGAPVIGAVGRFSAEKGHAVLIEAFAEVRRAIPRASLVLVGYGELEAELRRAADRVGGAVFTGERPSAEVLGAFDIFIQPSLYESQGLAILEAMAAGRPVIATDVGGVRDVVRPGDTGVLVPASDPAALAAAIVRLAADREDARRLSENAARFVREEFSVDQMVTAYARLYNQLLGR